MQSKIFLSALVNSLLLYSTLSLCSAASAAGNGLQDAINDYNRGQYAVGLSKFLTLEKQASTCSMAHYYAALCEQNLSQTSEAKTEFEWLLQYGNPTMKRYAQTGIENLGRRSASNRNGSVAPIIARASAPSSSQASVATTNGGVKRVLEFTTDWCSVCKATAPMVEESRSRLPGVQFENLNAEDPSNSALVSKYAVSAYPTFVFLDRSGNTLLRKVGGPRDASGLIRTIQAYGP